MEKGRPIAGTALHRRTAAGPGEPGHARDLAIKRKPLSGANLGIKAPGHDLRPRLKTMRHWITSFQLLNRDSECRTGAGCWKAPQ